MAAFSRCGVRGAAWADVVGDLEVVLRRWVDKIAFLAGV